MGLQDFIALSIAAAAALFAGRAIWRTINGGGCNSCPSKADPESDSARRTTTMRLTRKPMVTIDQVGLPRQSRPS